MSAARVLADIGAARTANEAETRAVLLSAAASILSEEGTAALTVRRLADAVHASTKMRGCWTPCTGTPSTG
jgi:AcrR family transcriptional regulator